MTKIVPAELPYSVRADLYTQLQALEAAGLSTQHALSSIRLKGEPQLRLDRMRTFLGQGMELCSAGERSGAFTPQEASMLRAATSAGSPAPTYGRLAEIYKDRALQSSRIRSGLAVPALVMLAAVFLRPLPGLVGGAITTGRYFFEVFASLAFFGGLIYLFLVLPRLLRKGELVEKRPDPTRAAMDEWLTRMPFFGPCHVRTNLRDYFESLALMLSAGMAILDALPLALSTITDTAMHKELSQLAPRIKQGATLSEALENFTFDASGDLIALVKTGEATGKLPEMLFRFAGAESAAVDTFYKQLAEWVPRIVYSLVALWVVVGIFTGPLSGPKIPLDPG